MRLLVISCPTAIPALGISAVNKEINLVNQLFDARLPVFHLRKPGVEIGYYRRWIDGIDPKYRERIALHEWHELADEFGIHRLHFSVAERMKRQGAKRDLSFDNIKSTSAHQLAELDMLEEFNYTFFGPAFDSISKVGYQGILPLGFKLLKPLPECEVIALGGINERNISAIKAMGFDGAALSGAIWNSPERALQTFKDCLALC